MDFFFNTLKKSLVATMFIVFAFVGTYIPQLPTSGVQEVEAGGAGGGATEGTQIANNVLLGSSLPQQTLTAANTAYSWAKEQTLDGIAWAIAKNVISDMLRSTINWVNSGFEGSPAFVTDLRGYMLEIADNTTGQFIDDIFGDNLPSICSPFKLDVAIAIERRYLQSRDKGGAPECTLSGIVNNIEGFISGVENQDPLSDWLTITSAPQTYTPYGTILHAQSLLEARIIGAQDEEQNELSWGDGFLSQKVCQSVSGVTGSQNCSIVKPGQMIASQLNEALALPGQVLVEADEINELLTALVGQVANKALTGAAGLLGLSGDDGSGTYTPAYSFLDDAVGESAGQVSDRADSDNAIYDSLEAEMDLRDRAQEMRPRFATFIANTGSDSKRRIAQEILNEIDAEITRTNNSISELTIAANEYTNASDEGKIDLLIEFSRTPNISNADVVQITTEWRSTATDIGLDLD